MADKTIEDRLAEAEARLARIEEELRLIFLEQHKPGNHGLVANFRKAAQEAAHNG
jgi:hypothetical protein